MGGFLKDEKQNMFQIRDFTPSTLLNPLKTKCNLFSVSVLNIHLVSKHKCRVGLDYKPIWTNWQLAQRDDITPISDMLYIRREEENYYRLGGNFLPSFRDNLQVLSSGVKN